MYKHVRAGYARNVAATGEWESGISNMMIGDNTQSIISPLVRSGLGEKIHVTRHTGPWDTSAADGIEELMDNRWWSTNRAASYLKLKRDQAVSIAAQGLDFGGRITEASLDLDLMQSLRTYVDENHDVDAKKSTTSYNGLAADATQGLLDAATKTPVKSENRCFHWEEHPDLRVDAANKILEIPLDKNLVGVMGQVVFSPMRVFSVSAVPSAASVPTAAQPPYQHADTNVARQAPASIPSALSLVSAEAARVDRAWAHRCGKGPDRYLSRLVQRG